MKMIHDRIIIDGDDMNQLAYYHVANDMDRANFANPKSKKAIEYNESYDFWKKEFEDEE